MQTAGRAVLHQTGIVFGPTGESGYVQVEASTGTYPWRGEAIVYVETVHPDGYTTVALTPEAAEALAVALLREARDARDMARQAVATWAR